MLQDFVSYRMSVTIVDPLEVIDVCNADAENGSLPLPAGDFARQYFDNGSPVVEPAQKIVRSPILCGFERANQFVLQLENADSPAQPGTQFLRIERFF